MTPQSAATTGEWTLTPQFTRETVQKVRLERRRLKLSGFIRKRDAFIDDLPIKNSDCKLEWLLGRRPDDQRSFAEFGL